MEWDRTVEAKRRYGVFMRIHYDWRLARVVDSDGEVFDELGWSPKRSVRALADRLSDLQSGRLSPEARALSKRFPDAEADGMAGFPFCLNPHLLPEVDRRIEMGELSLQNLARALGQMVHVSESDWPQLTNINTPKQLAAARARLQ